MEHKKKNTYTSCVFVLSMSIYSTIVDAKARGYMMMPQTEETLAGYLSPGGSSSLKKATLPTKPCRVTSSLVGKAFQAAGQAGAALHTMAVLQACQADLLKDLSTGGSIDEGAFSVRPSRRPVPSAVLWLEKTSVAQPHGHQGQRKNTFLLDAPISPSGLFGDAVNTVATRFGRQSATRRPL